jgi:Tfp pilus assembly protein PilF
MFRVRLITLIVSLCLLGCGAAPGGDSLDGANGDIGMPLSGAAQNNSTAWSLFKDGSYSGAKTAFNKTIASTEATATELADAYAGLGWCEMKLNGSNESIAHFRSALAKSSTQKDARVGLGGALLSLGTRDAVDESVTVLTGIDTGNANFQYVDNYNTGVSNAEAHAMLAYGYFVQGNRTKADQHMAIARDLDSQYAGTTVDQIDEVLSFIP